MASSSASSLAPAYPSAARISDSPCFPQYSASLRCLEESNQDKSKCQQQFDDYKECRKKEGFDNYPLGKKKEEGGSIRTQPEKILFPVKAAFNAYDEISPLLH